MEIHRFWNDRDDEHTACERGWVYKRVALRPLASKGYRGNAEFRLAQEVSGDEVG